MTGCVRDTRKWHTLRGRHLKQSKRDKHRQRKCQSWKWKACAGGVPLCVFLLVLVWSPFYGETVLGFAGLTGVSHWGKSRLLSFFFRFRMGSVWVLQCGCVWFQGQKWILQQCMPTGWQDSSLKDRPTLSVSFCFTFASSTLSTHFRNTSCTFFFFFFWPSFKQTM